MELVIVGSAGTFPPPGGACSGYLIREGDTQVLIDMGTGVLSRLYGTTDPRNINALVITHLHADHFVDIYPYRYYLQFTAEPEKLPLLTLAPAGAKERIGSLFTEPLDKLSEIFAFRAMEDGASYTIGGLHLSVYEVPHEKPTFSVMVEAGGKTLFYSSDTGYGEKLIDLATGVDLFLCECTLLKKYEKEKVAHLTTTQAARIATEADVGTLLLTHLWPHFDRRQILAEVREEFGGRIELAQDGATYLVGG